MKETRLRLSLLSLLLTSTLAAHAQQTPIQIHADLTDAPRKLYHADLTLPVHRGPLDLITPEWIPGAHGPDGPITNITGLRFEAAGQNDRALELLKKACSAKKYDEPAPG